ncbi:bifunctional methylenetetrahydrofolate dehydrogenase/methenyltetrahydrofolate cyclohydrolase FolD [Klebsiella pneumoniae]|uniref:bifunctional methylenetetrahydrofolate dehydrogenase/methenyltetrahydrofolate cyclohydrolase FolD n=1 Tax=Klebsiella pneumoniae TaxID=573 RepID=UPI0015E514A5|nr:bifunctional methylenetetrahydrofolate dehydrogenase/methenyltetrahydrofolate cyclohydrolase FolD [Klebsiella pneumoniae]QLO22088.1 bifunctional methylenetetrahydrofolate dehydrogenase/methenyltetrahydrofolate cyclohydrolase FolD [Klebsiella pneumoniae]
MNSQSGAARIDGKTFAKDLVRHIAEEVSQIRSETGLAPGLAVVLVGDDPASTIYVNAKQRETISAGMESLSFHLPSDVSQDVLMSLLDSLNHDSRVNGILVQLPLPAHLDTGAIINAIDPDKDVDGFHILNAGRLFTGQASLVPCTPLGCLKLLKSHIDDLTGMKAVVIGKSNIVGKPMAQLLLAENCTVTVAHIRTRNIAELCRTAEILVVAAGSPGLVRGGWVRPGAYVIDVGINRIEHEGRPRIVGDVAYDECGHAAAITPVPGGVGPMTIACLLENTLTAYHRQRRKAQNIE